MKTVKNHLRSVKQSFVEALIEFFEVDISYKEKRYIYLKNTNEKDPIRKDWENIGQDIRNSMNQFEKTLNEKKRVDPQYSLDFDNYIDRDGKTEEESGEKQPA